MNNQYPEYEIGLIRQLAQALGTMTTENASLLMEAGHWVDYAELYYGREEAHQLRLDIYDGFIPDLDLTKLTLVELRQLRQNIDGSAGLSWIGLDNSPLERAWHYRQALLERRAIPISVRRCLVCGQYVVPASADSDTAGQCDNPDCVLGAADGSVFLYRNGDMDKWRAEECLTPHNTVIIPVGVLDMRYNTPADGEGLVMKAQYIEQPMYYEVSLAPTYDRLVRVPVGAVTLKG